MFFSHFFFFQKKKKNGTKLYILNMMDEDFSLLGSIALVSKAKDTFVIHVCEKPF
jgi:hypothetical protein